MRVLESQTKEDGPLSGNRRGESGRPRSKLSMRNHKENHWKTTISASAARTGGNMKLRISSLSSSNTETHHARSDTGFGIFPLKTGYEMTNPSFGRKASYSSFCWSPSHIWFPLADFEDPYCMMSVYSALLPNIRQETWGDKQSLWRCDDSCLFFVTTSKWMFGSFLPTARRTFWHFTQSLYTHTVACMIPLTPGTSTENPCLCATVEKFSLVLYKLLFYIPLILIIRL